MTKQRILAKSGYERRPKATKRQRFLSEMDTVMPWARLISLVEPVQPKPGARGGRASCQAETMLRIHLMRQW